MVVAGCTGTEKTTIDSTIFNCSQPELVFNDSQETTEIGGIYYTRPDDYPKPMPGRVPLGGVVYRTPGFTRIFDSSGKQILLVNDSESIVTTPGGDATASCVQGIPSNVRFVDQGNDIRNVYIDGNNTCIASIINKGGSCIPPKIPK
jgi:hypothetical protein